MIPTALGIKGWLARTPTVDEIRPTHCRGCGRASRPVGGRLLIHGQGLVRRQIRGLLDPDGDPVVVEIAARRFECQGCLAVMTLVPAGVLAGRQYSGASIALALHLWLVVGLADVAVRARVCAWRVLGRSGRRGWAQLYRWVRDGAHLFPLPRPIFDGDPESAAKAALSMLVALVPLASRTSSIEARLFEGAALAR